MILSRAINFQSEESIFADAKRKTYFPVLIPPHAFVYCSKNSLDDPKGKTISEYESCIFRGVRSTLVVLLSMGREVEVARASAHNVGIRLGTTLYRIKRSSESSE
jgi:hypothetical protein